MAEVSSTGAAVQDAAPTPEQLGVTDVGLLGGGVIGGGWAARFLLNGVNVKLFDPDPEAERKVDEMLANASRAWGQLTDAPLPSPGEKMIGYETFTVPPLSGGGKESVRKDRATHDLTAASGSSPEAVAVATSPLAAMRNVTVTLPASAGSLRSPSS